MSGILLLGLRILLAASLYAFLGWALYTLWMDLKRESEILAVRQAPPITLKLNAPDQALSFTKNEISIGRDPASDLPLEDKTVSTQHARLVYHHNQWWIEDLGSTNGTFLNQERVSSPLVITEGDQIRCGQIVLEILIGSQSIQ